VAAGPDTSADPRTPLRVAFEARDHDAILRALAPDVILRSPIIDVPFEGRDEVGKLFAVLLEIFDDISYRAEVQTEDTRLLAFSATVGGTPVEGVDLLRFNAEGEVSEMTVFLRPLSGIAAFTDAAGPRLARRLGRSVAVVRATTPPATAAMRLMSRLAPRLLGIGRRADS
jgi:hypothetical protein